MTMKERLGASLWTYKPSGGYIHLFIVLRFQTSYNNCITAICVQAQTANIFARLFTFETGRLPLETEMFHRSCDVSH